MNTPRHFRNLGCAVAVGVLLWSAGCSSNDDGITGPETPTVSDEAPPLVPSGLESPKVDRDRCSVRWTAGAEADLAGYNVYLYDPDPSRTSAYVALTQFPVTRTAYVFVPGATTAAAHTYYLRVTAVDVDGHESALSDVLEVELGSPDPHEHSQQDPIGDENPFEGR